MRRVKGQLRERKKRENSINLESPKAQENELASRVERSAKRRRSATATQHVREVEADEELEVLFDGHTEFTKSEAEGDANVWQKVGTRLVNTGCASRCLILEGGVLVWQIDNTASML